MPVDEELNHQPDAMVARLVDESRGDVIPMTLVRMTDPWSAAVRGLCEYLAQLSIEWGDGNLLRLLEVREGWAEPEELGVWPSACVHSEIPGEYDYAALTSVEHVLEDGVSIRQTGELVQTLSIDLWCTSRNERSAIILMIEDALDPVAWMSGFNLTLPYYHNAVTTYLATQINVVDGTEEASKRWKLATITVQVTIPKLRVVGMVPRLDPRLQLDVTTDVIAS